MAITDKEQGVWILDEVYNKQNQGGIWDYDGMIGWYGMGKNDYGQLGQNDIESHSSPTQLPSGTGTWSKISASSGRHFFGLKTDGTAWAWGYNDNGQLGINVGAPAYTKKYRSSPTQIGTDNTWSSKFSCDDGNSFWIKTDGTLWSWGYNPNGALGLNSPFIGYPFAARSGQKSSPTQVGTDSTWSDVLGGGGSATALKTDGSLWSWGTNNNGELGRNTQGTSESRSSPVQIPGTWSKIASTTNTKWGIKTDGTLWGWGSDQFGKLAQNTNQVRLSSPTQVGTDTTWDKFGQGGSHVLAVKTDGTLWSWGYNQYGPLGQNQAKAQIESLSSPTQIPGTNWSQVAVGYLTSAATKTDGTFWTWGENEGGQLGQNEGGLPTNLSSPTQLPGTGWSDPAATRQEFFVKKLL
jgi:alpha-tubulin suppressor-like RCC1 family protein